jgi:hypothetical protein
MGLFKKKKVKLSGGWGWPESFTEMLIKKYEKDTGKKVDRNDPELEAQKIYSHWLKSFK